SQRDAGDAVISGAPRRNASMTADFSARRPPVNALEAIVLHALLNMIAAAGGGFRKNLKLEFNVKPQGSKKQAPTKGDGSAHQYGCHDGVGGPVRAARGLSGASLAQPPGRYARQVGRAAARAGGDPHRRGGERAAALRSAAHTSDSA